VQTDAGEREQIVEHKVTVADRIEAVGGHPRKAQRACQRPAIDRQPGAGQSTGAERACVGRIAGLPEPYEVTQKSLRMGQQKVRNENGLGRLQVRLARHGKAEHMFGLAVQRLHQHGNRSTGLACGVAHEQPRCRGDQLVTAAACPQLASQRSQTLDERRLDETVHVFDVAVAVKPTRVGPHSLLQLIKSRAQPRSLLRRQYTRTDQRIRPGAVNRQLVGQQAPVEAERIREASKLRIRGG